MLAVAGNETTRNSITHGTTAFANNPDQWKLYKKERPHTAADEGRPLGHPGVGFPAHRARTPTELNGVQIKKGQRLCCPTARPTSTKRSSTDPQDVSTPRDPNPHVGFGGRGAHFCIGVPGPDDHDSIFNAVADHMPDLRSVGERLRSGWLNGIKHWQVDYTGASIGS